MPKNDNNKAKYRGGSRNLITSKMELFFDKRSRIRAVNYRQLKSSILDFAAVLDPLLKYSRLLTFYYLVFQYISACIRPR